MNELWTGRLWDSISGTYKAILAHPFLDGLTDGTLPSESFTYYVAQDAHYLHDYARALAVVAAKAPTHADIGMFAAHAASTVQVELALHETLLAALGISAGELAEIPMSPTTRAYTAFLVSTAYTGSFAEGLAAVLPCYWIYAEVGAALVAQGSPDARYQRWIDTYADDAYAATVREVLDLADRIGPTLAPIDEARATEHFGAAARYEWMFWDAAWRREAWPL